MRTLETARFFMKQPYVIFFELWLDDDEDAEAVASALTGMRCHAKIDAHRNVVRAFPPGRKPYGLDLK